MAPASVATAPQPAPHSYHNLAYFSGIKATGNFVLNIKPTHKKPYVLLEGDEAGIAAMHVNVANDILYLRKEEIPPKKGQLPVPTHVKVTVYSPPIYTLSYSGVGVINATHFSTPGLEINLNHDGLVELSGRIGLRQLNLRGRGQTILRGVDSRSLTVTLQDGASAELRGVANLSNLAIRGGGRLDMYWIKSPSLSVVANGAASIRLAGIANTLYVELRDQASLDAKYLTSKEVFVKTFNNSTADIRVSDDQNVLASDASTVYFYKEPQLNAGFMAYSGSILDMQGVPHRLWY